MPWVEGDRLTPINMNNKSGTVYTVTDAAYNADPNGISDSAAGIQAALDAAASYGSLGGGVVYCPAGIYSISTTLRVPSNVMLMGQGGQDVLSTGTVSLGGTVFQPSASMETGPVIQNKSNNTSIVLRDFIIDGGRSSTYSHDGIYLNTGEASTIENVGIKNCSGYGIWADDHNVLRIKACNVLFNMTGGILLKDINDGAMIDTVMINNRQGVKSADSSNPDQHNLEMNNCSVWHITHCRFEWANGYNAWLHTGSGQNSFVNCFFDRAYWTGVYDNGGNSNRYIGCNFRRSGAVDDETSLLSCANVYIKDTAGTIMVGCDFVRNQQFDGGSGDTIPAVGLAIEAVANAIFIGNTLRNCSQDTDVQWVGTSENLWFMNTANEAAAGIYKVRMIDDNGNDEFAIVSTGNNETHVMHIPTGPNVDVPAAGTPGRLLYNSTISNIQFDDGVNWAQPFLAGQAATFDDQDQNPGVAKANFWLTGNTVATTINNFQNRTEAGQRITVYANDVNTTIAHDTSKISLIGQADISMSKHSIIEFVRATASGPWIQVRGF